MAVYMGLKWAPYLKPRRIRMPIRRISTTGRLLSQEFQQEGIPGSNLPFCIKNKYLFTLKFFAYCASALWAPFFILRLTLNRIYGPQPAIHPQQLTHVICGSKPE